MPASPKNCVGGTCKLPNPCVCQNNNNGPSKPRRPPARPAHGKATRAAIPRAVRPSAPAKKPAPKKKPPATSPAKLPPTQPHAQKKKKTPATIPPGTLARLRSVSRWEQEVLRLVNASRARAGVRPVRVSATLGGVARRHNADQAFVQRRISHVGSDGARIGDRMKREGYLFAYASENVAAGQKNPKHVHASLMSSPGHRRNLLSPQVVDMGLHVGRGTDGRLYWTQVFGRRKGKA